MRVRTRFAPSPTGDLHLGNARIAILNWAFARRHDGAFVLRFEDTDVDREVRGAGQAILDGLDWLGLDRDEGPIRGGPHGPYRQSERGARYRAQAARLAETGAAYPCYCSPEELEERRQAALEAGRSPGYDGRCRELGPEEREAMRSEGRVPSLRFAVVPGPVAFHDRIRGEIVIDAAEFGDFVILRADGRPTYNFAVVVDDIAMRITHVIRGAGHLSNTPRQVLLYAALGAVPPEFVHVPLVLGEDGKPLSKRTGAPGLGRFRDEGYDPAAIVNYLSLLSWSSPSGEEVLTRGRIVEEIDLDRLGAADVTVDPAKLRWLSGRHLRHDDPRRLAMRLAPFAARRGLVLSERELIAAATVLSERMHTLSGGADELASLIEPPAADEAARRALAEEDAGEVLRAARAALRACPAWDRNPVRAALDEARQGLESSGARFYHPVRAALTGTLEGPHMAEVAWVLGRDRVLERLDRALEALDGEDDHQP